MSVVEQPRPTHVGVLSLESSAENPVDKVQVGLEAQDTGAESTEEDASWKMAGRRHLQEKEEEEKGHGEKTTEREQKQVTEEGEDKSNSCSDELRPSLHDVKRALRRNFRDTGVIDDVTARLRRQFVSELQRTGLGVPGGRQAVAGRSPNDISLRERVLHSLVVDHLASNGLLQSLSVFLPESGLGTIIAAAPRTAAAIASSSDAAAKGTGSAYPAKQLHPGHIPAALSREDVLQGLPIAADSALFRRVLGRADEGSSSQNISPKATAAVASGAAGVTGSDGKGKEAAVLGGRGRVQGKSVCGLLEALVSEVAARSCAVAVDCNTQTEELGRSHKENLANRLEAVRDTWLRRAADERQTPARDVTERMLVYQRECESRAAAQVKTEVASFRKRDLTALRLQMAANQRREVDAMRRELQSQYDTRVERLQEVDGERERRHAERLRDAEAAQFEARQNLLREMDLLRTREQEARRGAELDARAVRAEELRVRDLSMSLESRADELRRREREGTRGREDALEAARHEARQAVQVKEENITREREFLRQEMEAVRAQRKACQEQLALHAETVTALQEARSEALAQEARARVAEAEAERLSEQAAVYKEAYERHREVTTDGDRIVVQFGREELEETVQSLERSLRKERGSHSAVLCEAVAERDRLTEEVQRLGAREQEWEAEATELSRALERAEFERDRAERYADEETCERTALDGQVNELRLLLRRSRDAIEAIRLCEPDAAAPSSSAITTRIATAAAATVGAGRAVCDPPSEEAPTPAAPITTTEAEIALYQDRPLLAECNVVAQHCPTRDIFQACPPPHTLLIGEDNHGYRHVQIHDHDSGHERGRDEQRQGHILPGGEAWRTGQERNTVFYSDRGGGGSGEGQDVPWMRQASGGVKNGRQWRGRGAREPGMRGGYWSDGQVDAVVSSTSASRLSRRRASCGTRTGRGESGTGRQQNRNSRRGMFAARAQGMGSVWRSVGDEPGHRFGCGFGYGGNALWAEGGGDYGVGGDRELTWEEGTTGTGSNEDISDEDASDDSGLRWKNRRHAKEMRPSDRLRPRRRRWRQQRPRQRRSESEATEHNGALGMNSRATGDRTTQERADMAERLLTAERDRMARELEAERARSRGMEEERRRERQEERARREEAEVEAMRRRLEAEEDKSAAASAAAAAAAANRRRKSLLEIDLRERRERREREEKTAAAAEFTVARKIAVDAGTSGQEHIVLSSPLDARRHDGQVLLAGERPAMTSSETVGIHFDRDNLSLAVPTATAAVETGAYEFVPKTVPAQTVVVPSSASSVAAKNAPLVHATDPEVGLGPDQETRKLQYQREQPLVALAPGTASSSFHVSPTQDVESTTTAPIRASTACPAFVGSGGMDPDSQSTTVSVAPTKSLQGNDSTAVVVAAAVSAARISDTVAVTALQNPPDFTAPTNDINTPRSTVTCMGSDRDRTVMKNHRGQNEVANAAAVGGSISRDVAGARGEEKEREKMEKNAVGVQGSGIEGKGGSAVVESEKADVGGGKNDNCVVVVGGGGGDSSTGLTPGTLNKDGNDDEEEAERRQACDDAAVKADADREVREYRERVRERRHQQQQQKQQANRTPTRRGITQEYAQHGNTGSASTSSPRSPALSSAEFEDERIVSPPSVASPIDDSDQEQQQQQQLQQQQHPTEIQNVPNLSESYDQGRVLGGGGTIDSSDSGATGSVRGGKGEDAVSLSVSGSTVDNAGSDNDWF